MTGKPSELDDSLRTKRFNTTCICFAYWAKPPSHGPIFMPTLFYLAKWASNTTLKPSWPGATTISSWPKNHSICNEWEENYKGLHMSSHFQSGIIVKGDLKEKSTLMLQQECLNQGRFIKGLFFHSTTLFML